MSTTAPHGFSGLATMQYAIDTLTAWAKEAGTEQAGALGDNTIIRVLQDQSRVMLTPVVTATQYGTSRVNISVEVRVSVLHPGTILTEEKLRESWQRRYVLWSFGRWHDAAGVVTASTVHGLLAHGVKLAGAERSGIALKTTCTLEDFALSTAQYLDSLLTECLQAQAKRPTEAQGDMLERLARGENVSTKGAGDRVLKHLRYCGWVVTHAGLSGVSGWREESGTLTEAGTAALLRYLKTDAEAGKVALQAMERQAARADYIARRDRAIAGDHFVSLRTKSVRECSTETGNALHTLKQALFDARHSEHAIAAMAGEVVVARAKWASESQFLQDAIADATRNFEQANPKPEAN